MQYLWFSLLFNYLLLPINVKAMIKGSSNETLLIGQINGPSSGTVRNLSGMILSINIFSNYTLIHSSLTPIINHTFPLNYSIVLNQEDFSLEDIKHCYITSIIWQPAYIFQSNVQLLENDIDTLNFEMQTIKFVIIRGEIIHDKHNQGTNLLNTHVKLEVIQEDEKGHIIDQVDFICQSKKYPCRFEYWLDTSRIKSNIDYRLEAILTEHRLSTRKSIHQKHNITKSVITKSTQPRNFRINSTMNTEINDYKIIVTDVEIQK